MVRKVFTLATLLIALVGETEALPLSSASCLKEYDINPALLSVHYTNTPQPVGLYLLDRSSYARKIWSGRPYDTLALADGSLWVAERTNNRILHLDKKGKTLEEIQDIKRPVDVEITVDGKVLVVVENQLGRVVGIDLRTKKKLWIRSGFFNPYDALPLGDGGLLVADSQNNRVIEFDNKGSIRWEKAFPFPNTIERLPNGNTIVTTYHHGEIIELSPKQRVVWKTRIMGTVFRAIRRKDGTTIVVEGEVGSRDKGLIHVVDKQGKIFCSSSFNAGGVVDIEILPDFFNHQQFLSW